MSPQPIFHAKTGMTQISGVWHQLLQNEWFAGLDSTLQAALTDNASVLKLSKGEALWHRLDEGNGLYCLLDGVVHVGAISWAGKELLAHVFYAVTWFGEVALLDDAGRTHEIICATDCHFLHIPAAWVRAACAKYPSLWRELGRLMAGKLRAAYANLEEVCLLPATARLASRLLTLNLRNDSPDASSRVEVHQESLALMLALSRQTVNRALNDLERAGAISVRYGGVQILSLALLRKFANDDV
jgi:CRP-like cAMP-binding protein